MLFYKICKGICNVLFRIIFKFQVIGKEKIPAEGKIIMCANHINILDPITLAIAVPRPIRFMAKKELFKNKFLRWFIEKLGAFPVDREGSDLSAIRNSMKILRNEEILGIFPEGTRVKKPDIKNAKPGIALIAIKAQAPIIPIYIESEYKPFRKILVRIGDPIKVDKYHKQKMTTEDYKKLSEYIMHSIYSLK